MADTNIAAGEVTSGMVTLAAGVVTTVTFSDNIRSVTIVNREPSGADVWFTVDGTTPTVGGKASWYLPAGAMHENFPTGANPDSVDGADVIKLISSGTPTVVVMRAR